MPKKGLAYNCPPKKFSVPPDVSTLGQYAKIITQAMRATFAKRISDANKK